MPRRPIFRRLAIAALVPGAAAVVVLGISRISFKVDILKSLPRDLDEVRGLELYLEHFSRPDELIVVLSGDDPHTVEEAAATLAEFLRAQPGLAGEVIDRAPWEGDPAGLAEIVACSLLSRPPAEFAGLENRLAPGQSTLALADALEELTFAVSPESAVLRAYDPFGLIEAAMGEGGASDFVSSGFSEFVSADGCLRVLYARAAAARDRAHYRDLIGWVGEMRAAVKRWSGTQPVAGSVSVRLTGEPAFVAEISGGMERDMKSSGLSTIVLVGAVFWFCYRRLLPLAMLVAMLIITFLITLSLAGFAISDITVMSVGFASILIGLSVDYGVLVYQESLQFPGDAAAVRRKCRRGILCAGATTALAFGSLATSSLPALSQLGLLVAIGIAVGAAVMLGPFAALIGAMSRSWRAAGREDQITRPTSLIFSPAVANAVSWVTLALLAIAAATLLIAGPPPLDATSKTLRPRNSEAYAALDDLSARLLDGRDAGSMLVIGEDAPALRRHLENLEPVLAQARDRGELSSFMVPTALVPDPARQQSNLRGGASRIAAQAGRLSSELAEAGFADEGAALFRGVLETWERWREREDPIVPGSPAARWIHGRVLATSPLDGSMLAAVRFVPSAGADLRHLAAQQGVFLADWNQTMLAVLDRIPSEIFRILAVLAAVFLSMLVFTFRGMREIAWVVLCLALSLTMLLGFMRLFGWSWNFLNLATLLLTFGAGIDYSIHMLLGFQRSGNDVAGVQRDTGQALTVCALTTVAGFGSLAWASNIGLASLGKLCALGIFFNALVAVFLLPRLRLWLARGR